MVEPVRLMRLRGERSLAIQRNALEAALTIVNDRVANCRRTETEWAVKYPDDKLGQATERAARQEAELIAMQIGELLARGGKAAGEG